MKTRKTQSIRCRPLSKQIEEVKFRVFKYTRSLAQVKAYFCKGYSSLISCGTRLRGYENMGGDGGLKLHIRPRLISTQEYWENIDIVRHNNANKCYEKPPQKM